MSWLARLRRPKPYRAEDFARRERFRDDYRRLAGHLLVELSFDSAYDVGCANGFLLAAFREAGKRVAGIELSPAVRRVLDPELQPLVEVGDFAAAAGHWDLVCCVEVAEHLPPPRSRELVDALARLAGRWIYFTAAPPGQVGRGHINCRPHDEWLGWFAAAGWALDEARTERLRDHLGGLTETPWLRTNSMLLSPVRSTGEG